MTEILQFLVVPLITVAVYAVIAVINKATGESEKFKRFIPLVALVLGIAIGIICYYALPEVLSASSLAMAVVMGGASGLAATGGDQVIKQLTKPSEDKESDYETIDENGITVDDLAKTVAASVTDELLKQLKTDEAETREKSDS